MKKNFNLLFVVLFLVSANTIFSSCNLASKPNEEQLASKSDEKCLTFMGIPIKGSPDTFHKALETKGFEEVTNMVKVDDSKEFSGTFLNSPVFVKAIIKGNNVCGVSIFFEDTYEWDIIKSNFSSIKNLYTKKYGKPSELIEKEEPREYQRNKPFYALEEGNAKFYAKFESEFGFIVLEMKTGCVFDGHLELTYVADNHYDESLLNEI